MVITGTARGIGEAIARAFVPEGANAYATDIETEAGEALALDIGVGVIFKRFGVRNRASQFAAILSIPPQFLR